MTTKHSKPSQPQPLISLSENQPLQPLPHLYSFPSAYSPKIKSALYFNPADDRTKQSFKDECDINVILQRYAATGQITHINERAPMWGDAPALDFAGAMALVVKAREEFAALPANVRDRFNNNPQELLNFLSKAENQEEAVKLGLAAARTPPPQPPEKKEEKSA